MQQIKYILIVIGLVSVVSVMAATFGKPYQPQRRGAQYAQNYSEMPTLSMSTMNAAMMSSGSALPMAAVTGTTTADDYTPARSSRPRRVEGSGTEGDDDPDEPGEPMPIGDAVLPLMLFACAYFIWRATRKRRVKTLNG